MPVNQREGGRYEFSETVKQAALSRAECRCERCTKHQKQIGRLFFHHRLSVSAVKNHHPRIDPSLVSSLNNCMVLCKECHEVQDEIDQHNHKMLAQALLGLAETTD